MKMFVDSGAWYALADAADEHHRAATEFVRQLDAVFLLTTDYIVDETVTLLLFGLSHRAAVAFLRSVHRSARLSCEQVTPDHLRRAEHIFTRYSDKRWSFTDCVSFAFMEDHGLKDAFTFDGNFEEFGLRMHPRVAR